MPPTEQVLVVERKAIEDIAPFNGLMFDTAPYLEKIFSPGTLSFMLRPDAENNPNFKQLIPYVIMASGDTYLTYVRGKRAGEKRLLGNRSIGIALQAIIR